MKQVFFLYALCFLCTLEFDVAAQPATVTAAIGNPANGAAHYISLAWTPVAGAASYDVENSPDGNNWTNIYSGTAMGYSHNTGNSGNQPNYYRARSVTGATPSAWVNATPYPIYSACDAPEVPLLSSATSSGMSLALVPESPVPNPAYTTYSVYCATASQYVQVNGTLGAGEVFQTMAAWGTVNISGLAASTNYCFYAKAKNTDGDIRTAAGGTLMPAEPFTTNANFSTQSGSGPTNRFWSPSSCTTGGLQYFGSNGCTDGYVGFSGAWNNYFGCFLRTPQQDCSGNTAVVIRFDLSNSYIASHIVTSPSSSDAIRFYMWVDNAYKNASSVKINGVEAGVSDINGMWLKFDALRNCVTVEVTFDLTVSTNLTNILFYLEPNCGYNDSQAFSVKIDNVSLLGSANASACLSTTACSAATIQMHPSNQTICANANASFSIIAGGSVASYLWQESTNGGSSWNPVSNGGIYSNATTPTLSITGATSGMNGYLYRCNVTGSCSGNPTSTAGMLTINPAPGAAGTITGMASVCQGESGIVFSVSSVSSAASYSWSVPTGATITNGSGTNSITVSFSGSASSGNVQVTPSNTCGQGTASPAFAVTVNQLPASPASITGNTNLCESSSQTYSIATVSGATSYTWTLPAGWTGTSTTETINTTAGSNGGTVSVTANNSCGSSAAQSMTVTVATLPAMPSGINGPDIVCSGSSQTYSVSPVVGATSYLWTLPAGWTGSSSSDNINTIAQGNSGNISVAAVNSCGTSSTQTKAVTVTPAPTVTFDFAGNPVCDNATPFPLSGTPAGGTFSGNGVVNDSLFPKLMSDGNHILTYGYIDSSGCAGSDTALVVIEICSGIEILSASDVVFYPNPFNDYILIKSATAAIKAVLLFDTYGKELLQKENPGILNVLSIDVSDDIPPGIYHLKIITGNNQTEIRRLVKI